MIVCWIERERLTNLLSKLPGPPARNNVVSSILSSALIFLSHSPPFCKRYPTWIPLSRLNDLDSDAHLALEHYQNRNAGSYSHSKKGSAKGVECLDWGLMEQVVPVVGVKVGFRFGVPHRRSESGIVDPFSQTHRWQQSWTDKMKTFSLLGEIRGRPTSQNFKDDRSSLRPRCVRKGRFDREFSISLIRSSSQINYLPKRRNG